MSNKLSFADLYAIERHCEEKAAYYENFASMKFEMEDPEKKSLENQLLFYKKIAAKADVAMYHQLVRIFEIKGEPESTTDIYNNNYKIEIKLIKRLRNGNTLRLVTITRLEDEKEVYRMEWEDNKTISENIEFIKNNFKKFVK